MKNEHKTKIEIAGAWGIRLNNHVRATKDCEMLSWQKNRKFRKKAKDT
jgi:hypothetical protein